MRHSHHPLHRLLRNVSFVALMLPVLASPWLFASVQPWAQLACLCLVSTACVGVVALSLVDGPKVNGDGLPAVGWVAIALILLGIVQLIPMTHQQLASVSPRAAEIRHDFGQDQTQVAPITLNPARTRTALALLVLSALVYMVTYRLADQQSVEIAMLMIAINGACLTGYAFLLRQTESELVYGLVTTTKTAMGPFVNRNNAAGFLLACAAAALVVVALNFLRLRRESSPHLSVLIAPTENPRGFVALVCLVAIIYGIWMSESRGALLGLVVGTAAASTLCLRRDHVKFAFAFVIGLIVFLGLATSFSGHWDSTTQRAATLLDEHELAGDGRLSIWSSSVDFARDFSLTGSGLGTFRDVFRLYDQHANGTLATYAENTWVEMACAGGLIGFGLLLALLVVMSLMVYRMLTDRDLDLSAVGAVGVFFVASQFVASQFDFGLSIAANLIAVAFLTGAFNAAGTVWLEGDSEADSLMHSSRGRWLGRILVDRQFEVVLVGLAVLAVTVGMDLMHASSVETVQTFSGRPSVGEQRSVSHVEERQRVRLLRNIHQRWDDAEAHYALAESCIRQYETSLRENAQSLGLPVKTVAELRPLVVALRSDDRFAAGMEKLRQARPTSQWLLPALRHLHAARTANCLIPNVHLRLHHLSVLDLEEEIDDTHFSRAIWLWEGRRHEFFVDGLSHYRDGSYSQAFAAWRPCLIEKSRYRTQIVALATRVADPEMLMQELFPASPAFLSELISRDLTNPEQRELKDKMIKIYDAKHGENRTR